MNHALAVLIVCVIAGSAEAGPTKAAAQRDRAGSRIYKLDELTWPQIDALDRQRTLFILPVGMIEQHGPHLPVGADTIGVVYEANGTATRVSRALPDWNVVMMPSINYGQSGANQLGDMPVHPGTYSIRQSTLRSLVADLGGQIAQNGFKWIFVLNGHGAPTHNIAINEACDFVSETFRVTMLHVTALFRADAAIQSSGERMNARYFSAAELSSFGMDVHAGVGETSGMLAVRPDLVRPNLQNAPQPSGEFSRGVARDRDGSGLAGLSLVAGEGDGGARPSRRGMVDRRVHGTDPTRRARGEHVRPCACSRDDTCRRGPDSREGTRERSRIRREARKLVGATEKAVSGNPVCPSPDLSHNALTIDRRRSTFGCI